MMNCLYCKKQGEGKFCSHCGEEYILGFSAENFKRVLGYVHNNKNVYISKQFDKKISLGRGFGGLISVNNFYKSFELFGYLLRVTEEIVSDRKIGKQEEIIQIIKKQGVSLGERLEEAANFIDTKMSEGFRLSFSNIPTQLFLIEKEQIVDVLDRDINLNIEKAIESVENGKTSFSLEKNNQNNIDNFVEILLRHAVYGYCYRIAEECLESCGDYCLEGLAK